MICYFTGTGNTRWVAQQLAQATGERLVWIPDELKRKGATLHYVLEDGERLGFCFPTHGWQPPRIVREFIRRASFTTSQDDRSQLTGGADRPAYVYAVTTCGDNMGHAMRILNKELRRKGLRAESVFAVLMPESNVCFPFLHLDTPEREQAKIEKARETVRHICDKVKARQRDVSELIPGAIPYTYTYVIGGFYNRHLINDNKFWVDPQACTRCGVCSKLCPVGDIECLPPRWKHDGSCTNCLACYHHCPQHAIHWGKMKRGQYVFKMKEPAK